MISSIVPIPGSNIGSTALKLGLAVGVGVGAWFLLRNKLDKIEEKKIEEQKTEEQKQTYTDANVKVTGASALARKLYSEIVESSGFVDDEKVIRLGLQVGNMKEVSDAYTALTKGKILDKALNSAMSPAEVQQFYNNAKAMAFGYDPNGKRFAPPGSRGDRYLQEVTNAFIYYLKPDSAFTTVDRNKLITWAYYVFNMDSITARFKVTTRGKLGKEYDLRTEVKKVLNDEQLNEFNQAIETNRYLPEFKY